MDLDLKGKRALVTGASRGIGRAIAERLAQEGCDIAICARGKDGVEAAATAIRAQGVRCHAAAFDVRDGAAFAGWIGDAAAALGGVDILVSNVSTRIDPSGPDWWRESFEVDLHQHVQALDLALPHLKAGRDPSALFVGSIAATMTTLPPYEIAYGAMKAALTSYTGQMAQVHGRSGIRVNAVAPGPVMFEGGWWDGIKAKSPEGFARAERISALGRMATPDDVANAVAFLVSPAAGYITGVNLRVDGGAIKTANY
jgi:NAD(P)-dependent dehydrogenase (short-subunit alcohol dehydrogenase family)